MLKNLLIITILLIWSNSSFASQDFKHGISIFGDLKYKENFKNFDYVNISAKKGGHVKFGVEGGFNSLNQFILKGISASGLSYIYDSLTEGSDDEISSRYGLVASTIKLSNDKMSIEFKLRKNAYFHDGKKITADDVIFTFNKLINEGHPSYKMSFRDVKSVEKINDYHVKFNFKNNKNRDLPILISSLPVLPKHYYQKIDFQKTSMIPPLGSGPYKISEVKANKSIIYERVENYWAKDLAVNMGRYNFNKITFDYYHDANVLVEAFKSQKYDFRQENVARNWANLYNIEAIKNGEITKEEIKHSLPAPMQAFIFNMRRQKFNDVNLRKAITLAFDFEWLRKNIFYNSYIRTNSYFANSDFGYKDFKLPKSLGDGFNRSNLIEAKNILNKSGYKIYKNNLYDSKNQLIEIEFLIDQKTFEMIIAPFINNLKKLGIKAKIKFVEENQYQTRINNYDYDIITAVFPQALIPGFELYSYFHSSQINIKGGRNLVGINNIAIDDLINKILKSNSKNELILLSKDLDKKLLEEYYLIPQWHNNSYRILYRNIFAMPKIKPNYALAIDSWWIK